MKKTILVCGYGPGISRAVAERFGKEGFAVGLVARNAEKLAAAKAALGAAGVTADGLVADLGDPAAVRRAVGEARATLGPIAAIHWNGYSGAAGDLMKADATELHAALDVATLGLLAAVQAAHEDLRREKGSVLVTNGGFALLDPGVDAAAVSSGSMGLALANAAKQKLVGLLATRLAPDGIYVGQVIVMGQVKGTAWDSGQATIEPTTVAEKFWKLHVERAPTTTDVRG